MLRLMISMKFYSDSRNFKINQKPFLTSLALKKTEKIYKKISTFYSMFKTNFQHSIKKDSG